MNARLAMLLVVLPATLFAQATVEAAAGASRAATTVAPAQEIGKKITGAFDNLNRALQGSGKPSSSAPGTTSSPAGARPSSAAVGPRTSAPKAGVSFEDPSGIQDGMEYAEVTRRFGPPLLKLTAGPDQETLCYTRKDMNIDVTVRSGKVTAVQKTGVPEPTATGIIK